MATARILLGILCFIAVGSYGLPGSHLLKDAAERQKLLSIALAEVGVRESTGNNDGAKVEAYLSVVKLKKGQPWCAAFISWIFARAAYPAPRTGWSPALFNRRVNTSEALPGNVFGIWFGSLGRIAHVGMVEKLQGDWLLTIEGNTNIAGNREGDGVYRKWRHVKTVRGYADWLKQERAAP
jgi:hypothetical protein